MPPTDDKYISNVIDINTWYIAPAAVPINSTKDALKHLHSLFYRFGTPDDCISDHAMTVESHQFQSLRCMRGVNMHFFVAKCAASNEPMERVNGTLVAVLRKMCEGDQSLWTTKLDEAAFAANTTHHDSTTFSLFQLPPWFSPKLLQKTFRPHQRRSVTENLLTLPELNQAARNPEGSQEKLKTTYAKPIDTPPSTLVTLFGNRLSTYFLFSHFLVNSGPLTRRSRNVVLLRLSFVLRSTSLR